MSGPRLLVLDVETAPILGFTCPTLPERFWSKVAKSEGCWLWTAATDTKGYGKIGVGGRTLGAHRVSYALHYGDPSGFVVMHTCDTPPCVNPHHLRLGTQAENLQDMARKGRQWGQAKTECPSGHSLENAYRYGFKRVCRTCRHQQYLRRRGKAEA